MGKNEGDTMKTLRYVLITILLVILGLNMLLRLFDPLGVIRYSNQSRALFQLAIPHPTGYRLTPGYHDIGYQLTIGLDGLRIVPDSNMLADCTIAVIGDSVAFGMGVHDTESIVNLLARAYPDVYWINASLPAYNVGNITRQLDSVSANGYLWFVVQNDNEPDYYYQTVSRKAPATALARYIDALTTHYDYRTEDFASRADAIVSRSDVLTAAFENYILTDDIHSAYPDVLVIPLWTHNISPFDPHPNAQGHQEIAQAINPYIPEFITEICHAE